MFFSSGEYAGYGKGQYSHAVPAGVAFIGLLFVAVGLIIAISFPGIVSDWTKADVCVVRETDKRFKNWLTDADRDVTVSVSIRNLSSLDAVMRLGEEPQYDWTDPFIFQEKSQKTDVRFFGDDDHRVTFRKDIVYRADDGSVMDAALSVPNLWLLRQYGTLGDPASWFYHVLPQLLNDTATVWGADWTPVSFWVNLSLSDCSNRTANVNLCPRFSFPNWAKQRNFVINTVDVDETRQPWKHLLRDVLTETLTRNELRLADTCQSGLAVLAGRRIKSEGTEIDFRCPACFFELTSIQLLLMNHYMIREYRYNHAHDQAVWSLLKSCYIQGPIFAGSSITDQQFHGLISAVDEYFFQHMRRQLLLDRASRRGIYETDNAMVIATAEPVTTDQSQWRLGLLPAVFGDHLYDWNTCHVRWNIDANINFQWRSLDKKPIELESKSEYFVPPASGIDPCLRPRAPRRLTLLLDGLWRPATFSFANTGLMHQETVYNYELAAGALPVDDDLSDDLQLNVTDVLGFHSFITPVTISPDLDQVVAMIQVEPLTGSIWQTNLTFELSIQLSDELAMAANLSRLAGQRMAIARISRNSTVRPQAAEFLTTQLKPMLAVICGGVVVSSLLAIAFVGLALALVLKLHWKPFRERVQWYRERDDGLRLADENTASVYESATDDSIFYKRSESLRGKNAETDDESANNVENLR